MLAKGTICFVCDLECGCDVYLSDYAELMGWMGASDARRWECSDVLIIAMINCGNWWMSKRHCVIIWSEVTRVG